MMDYKGCKCASCHKVLKEGDDIVICPECGAPYHRECYAAEGRCVFSAKHGKGFEYVPPEAKPDVNANGPICPVCHAQNPPDTLFCERCGQPMRGGVPPQAAQSSPQYAEPGMSGTGMPGGFGGPGAQYATGDVMTQNRGDWPGKCDHRGSDLETASAIFLPDFIWNFFSAAL